MKIQESRRIVSYIPSKPYTSFQFTQGYQNEVESKADKSRDTVLSLSATSGEIGFNAYNGFEESLLFSFRSLCF